MAIKNTLLTSLVSFFFQDGVPKMPKKSKFFKNNVKTEFPIAFLSKINAPYVKKIFCSKIQNDSQKCQWMIIFQKSYQEWIPHSYFIRNWYLSCQKQNFENLSSENHIFGATPNQNRYPIFFWYLFWFSLYLSSKNFRNYDVGKSQNFSVLHWTVFSNTRKTTRGDWIHPSPGLNGVNTRL